MRLFSVTANLAASALAPNIGQIVCFVVFIVFGSGFRSFTIWDGGADRDRTGDLLLAKQALSQLSYSPQTLTIE